jgi:hypothetical protein
VVKSVQYTARYQMAGLVEAMPLALHLHRAMPALHGKPALSRTPS